MTEHRREYLRKYFREWRKTHKTWAQTHRAERRAYFKEYYRKNKEKWGVAASPIQAILKELLNEQYENC